jgi:hypothetical protein
MTFGITAAEAAVAIAAVGAAVGTYSAVQAGQAQKAAAQYQSQVAANNATIASMNANAATAQGNQQLQAAQEQAAQHQGMIRAAFGAGGIDLNSGSALRDQQGVAEVDSLNEQTITSNAARQAWNYQNQSGNYDASSALAAQSANSASTAGYLSGFSSILGGAGTIADRYSKVNPPAATPT